jgi:hypothetical protein
MFATAQAKVDSLTFSDLNEDIRTLKRNVRLAMMAKLGRNAEFLRHVQSEYSQRLEYNSPRTPLHKFSSPSNEQASDLESHQLLQDQIVRDHEIRDREITAIQDSLTQVIDLLRGMHALTIGQGSLLDQIDYNLERTRHYLHRGNQHLQKASHRSESSKLVLLFLLMLILLLILAVIWRAVQ